MLSAHKRDTACLSCAHEQHPTEKHGFVETVDKHDIKKWIDLELNIKSKFVHNTTHNMERWTRPNPHESIVVTFSDAARHLISDPNNVENYLALGNQSADIDDFELSKAAFNEFAKNNRHNPEYIDKYVVFVYGRLYGVGNTEVELIKKVYQNVGNVDMYVGNVSREIQTELIESPESL